MHAHTHTVPGVINMTMLQTGRKLPLALSLQRPVSKSASLPDTSFSRSLTLCSSESDDSDDLDRDGYLSAASPAPGACRPGRGHLGSALSDASSGSGPGDSDAFLTDW